MLHNLQSLDQTYGSMQSGFIFRWVFVRGKHVQLKVLEWTIFADDAFGKILSLSVAWKAACSSFCSKLPWYCMTQTKRRNESLSVILTKKPTWRLTNDQGCFLMHHCGSPDPLGHKGTCSWNEHLMLIPSLDYSKEAYPRCNFHFFLSLSSSISVLTVYRANPSPRDCQLYHVLPSTIVER